MNGTMERRMAQVVTPAARHERDLDVVPYPVRVRPDAQRGPEALVEDYMERVTGLEPATLGLGSRCSTTELHPHDACVL